MERVFGVLKKKWGILVCPLHFSMEIQAMAPPAMCALHNFILDVDPRDINNYLTGNDEYDLGPNPGQVWGENSFRHLAATAVTAEEKACALTNHDHIARYMWNDYQQILHEHGSRYLKIIKVCIKSKCKVMTVVTKD
ncbi:hypothetical protein BDQ17DRAFT_1462191 [Cyathus striatus]|nr:hypothetical protein BDQ17DRAFT_1462191 [Cyathus striatus]